MRYKIVIAHGLGLLPEYNYLARITFWLLSSSLGYNYVPRTYRAIAYASGETTVVNANANVLSLAHAQHLFSSLTGTQGKPESCIRRL